MSDKEIKLMRANNLTRRQHRMLPKLVNAVSYAKSVRKMAVRRHRGIDPQIPQEAGTEKDTGRDYRYGYLLYLRLNPVPIVLSVPTVRKYMRERNIKTGSYRAKPCIQGDGSFDVGINNDAVHRIVTVLALSNAGESRLAFRSIRTSHEHR